MARAYLKEKPLVVILTFIGLKPVIDAIRIVFDVEKAEGQAFDQDFTFAVTRIFETCFETIFQAFVFATMAPAYRQTFYKHYTLATYLAEYVWDEATAVNARGQLLTNCGHERIRADVIDDYTRQYWPMDRVADFVAEGWPRWVADPPDWFDDVWKARVPPRLIPQDDRPAQLVLPAPPAAADEGD